MADRSLTSSFFIGNRARLFKSLDVDILVITANGLLQKSADQAYPFRQDSNFWYLTGISEPDLILVMTKNEEFIITPDLFNKSHTVIEPVDKSYLSKISGVEQIVSETEGWQKIKSSLSSKSKLGTLLPSPVRIKFHGIYASPARRQLVAKLKRLFPKLLVVDCRQQLARAKMVKQPIEIQLIQKSLDITTDTLAQVLAHSNLMKYKDSGEIERDILAGFLKRGASGHAFDPVVASGVDATYIHFQKLDQPLKRNELIVCDVGSDYSFYSADIARTVIYGQPSSRAQAVFEAVAEVQKSAYKLIKAGMSYKDYEKQVEILIGEQLKNLGLITTINRKSVRKYYTHYCSHSLGLDTHDSADYSISLPENMVMAVEPGIYIREEAIGVRIEDVVLITNSGCQVMSSSLPTDLKL